MFAGGFGRARLVRRAISTVAALLAVVGGLLAMAESLTHGLVVGSLVSLAALLGAWWIYRGGRALLFPRARLSFAGFLTTAAGVILVVLGYGLDGFLVVAGGILSWVGTIL
jgi:hypothetical protein